MQFLASLDVDGILRGLWASLCQVIYKLIAFLYELFINLASVKLLTDNNIKPIYQRVTLILAIIMVFYVTLEVVKYVVEPDKMTDKEKGASNIVKRMIVVILLIAFVPTIFGLAYDLQNSLIKNQVFSKMILGRTNGDMQKVGKEFSAQMFSLFYRYDNEFWEQQGFSEDKLQCDGTTCAIVVDMNISTLASDGELPYIHMGLNEKQKVSTTSGKGNKQEIRKITFDGLLAVAVGGFVCYVLLLYCIDVGVRVAQLLFLQVIAPIPIIGYLAPKKDGMFQKWLKQCVTTYLDLFIRLAIICFVLLIIEILGDAYQSQTLVNNVGNVSGTMKTFMYIAIVMGLLLFAQKAPKMLQELFPKMGAASGNFGLKAGERVAPAAARTIGAGLGATRLLTGAVARGANTFRRNRQERERTGKTRKEQRNDIKKERQSMKSDRKDYRQAVSQRNKALRRGTYKTGDAAYEAAQKDIQKKRDKFVESQSKYADSQNSKYRSVVLNAMAGAAGGAYRGARAGYGATKLEDIGKKVKEGYANDKKAVNAREQWLNSGGYSNVRRAVAGVEQSIGMTTPAGKTERDINVYDSQIKANERLIATESDVKSKEDAAKDRSSSKIEAGEQKTVIPSDKVSDLKITGLDGVSKKPIELPPVEYDTDGRALPITTSAVYAHYKAKAESAKANADAAAQVYQDLRAAKLRGEPVDDKTLEDAGTAANVAEKNATIAADEQGKVKKALLEYAITDILQGKQDYQDGVLQQKVADTLTSIAETTRDEKTKEYMKLALRVQAKDANGNLMFEGEGENKKPVWDDVASQKAYDDYINGNITSYKQMDDIQTALINSANARTRENVAIKGSKSRLEASSNYDAQKADDKSTSGGGK